MCPTHGENHGLRRPWDSSRWQQTLALPGAQLGLDPEFAALRPQFQGHWFPCLPSTNDTLWDLIGAGAPSGTVAIAAQQTTGRGQWGRTWTSPLGGLYLSLGLELPTAPFPGLALPNPWPLLTLATAWGIAAALNHLGIAVGIKWPNDLVYPGLPAPASSPQKPAFKKLGGILTEVRSPQPGQPWAVIGLGLNWQNPVPPPGQALWPLRPHPLPPDYPLGQLEDLAAIAVRAIAQGYYGWQQWPTPTLLQRYQAHLTSLGQRVCLEGGHWGTVTGLSPEGYLEVTGFDGPRVFRPGQVRLGYGEAESPPGEPDSPQTPLNPWGKASRYNM